MNYTPRTDAHIDGLRRDPEVSGCDRTLDFCRQLERELNAANQIAKKYEDRYFAALERIKRLEEAGDELLMWLLEDVYESNGQLLQDAWHKAKEVKP